MTEPLLTVSDLSVTFNPSTKPVYAVRGVDYTVNQGEFLGIVGESGSGKSVSSMAVMGLPREVSDIVSKGDARMLERVPGIGPSLAETIARYSTSPDDRVSAEESARRSAGLTAA